MRRIDGERLGHWSLRLDAGYCAVLGAVTAIFAGRIAESATLPPIVVAIVGCAVIGWAGGLLWMIGNLKLRLALRLVMVANVFASIAVLAVSATAATLLLAVTIVAVAVDVALFAVSQAIALRAMPAVG